MDKEIKRIKDSLRSDDTNTQNLDIMDDFESINKKDSNISENMFTSSNYD